MPRTPLKVVLDTNIFVQYFLKPTGPSALCLRALGRGRAELFVSKDILAELGRVLVRPRIAARAPDNSAEAVEAFIRFLSEIASVEDPVRHSLDFARDPKDEIIIDLAIQVKADFIVSRDKDLLDLMIGYSDPCKEFRRRFRFLKIIEPSALIALLEKSAELEDSRT